MINAKEVLKRGVAILRKLFIVGGILFMIFGLIHTGVGVMKGDLAKGHVFGTSVSVGNGASMEPTIRNGTPTLMIEKKVAFEDLQVGDIIRFRAIDYGKEIQVVHRIIEINKRGRIITKGDGNTTDDPSTWEINSDTYLGRVDYIIKKGLIRSLRKDMPQYTTNDIMSRKIRQLNNK